MNVRPTWSMFGWVYLSQFVLSLLMEWRLLLSTNFRVALVSSAAEALWASTLVILGVWMYKLDHRKLIKKPAIIDSPNQDLE
jgi:hypothetical protein